MSKEAQSSRNNRSPKACWRLIGIILWTTCFIFIIDKYSWGAVYKTSNFIVEAESADFAKEVAETAEQFRIELAKLWLGNVMPQWGTPCQIQVEVGDNLGAGGNLSFTFDKGEVFGWSMTIQGSRERILDSVVPHEITHTIFASYLREPVPRWIDEGAATSVESQVERANYRNMLIDFLKEKRGIPFLEMVRLREYPKDSKDMLTFYSQGFSVCEYLIMIGGHRRLIEFAQLGVKSGNWNHALKKIYDFENLGELQLDWTQWINNWYADYYLAGRPDLFPPVQRLIDYQSNPTNSSSSVSSVAIADSSQNAAPSTTLSSIASNETAIPSANLVAGNLVSGQSFEHSIASNDWTSESHNINESHNLFENGVGSTTPYFSAKESNNNQKSLSITSKGNNSENLTLNQKSKSESNQNPNFDSNSELNSLTTSTPSSTSGSISSSTSNSFSQNELLATHLHYQGSYGMGMTSQSSLQPKNSGVSKSDSSNIRILAQQKN